MSDPLVEVSTHTFTMACWSEGTPTRVQSGEFSVDYFHNGERIGRIEFSDTRGRMRRYVVQRLANLAG